MLPFMPRKRNSYTDYQDCHHLLIINYIMMIIKICVTIHANQKNSYIDYQDCHDFAYYTLYHDDHENLRYHSCQPKEIVTQIIKIVMILFIILYIMMIMKICVTIHS